MDEIFIIPKISTYTFGPKEINEYKVKDHTHPYIDTSISHPEKNGYFNYLSVHFELFLNRRLTYYSINSDVLFYNVNDWYDTHYQTSQFYPFAIYLDEIIYQQPIKYKSTNDFVLWEIDPSDIRTLKITNKSQFIFSKNQYQNSLKYALERLFTFPKLFNVPADKIFLPDEESITEFQSRLLTKNIVK